MPDPCPRCGADRRAVGPCPECGYEPAHPGVLGAYREALGRIRERPSLLLPFAIPAALLLGAEAVLAATPGGATARTGGQALATVLAGLLVTTWYMEALALATAGLERGGTFPTWPSPSVHRASVAAALVVVAPWAAVVALVAWSPSGTLGGLALLAVFVLLVLAVFATGRAVGLPVEAALARDGDRGVLGAGNRRARENGGLGLVFLGFLVLALPSLALGIAEGLELVTLAPSLSMGIRGVVRWGLGAWIGVAVAVGLVGAQPTPERSFTCPVCGADAVVEGGRARCECGLEGPYYTAGAPEH